MPLVKEQPGDYLPAHSLGAARRPAGLPSLAAHQQADSTLEKVAFLRHFKICKRGLSWCASSVKSKLSSIHRNLLYTQ